MGVAVIGAGISGLMAAAHLREAGVDVVVYEKAKGVGGRMASRRLGDALFDLGAQYFTARDPAFRAWVEAWTAAGSVRCWATGFRDAEGTLHDNGEARFVGADGMTGVPKALAQGLVVHLNRAVASIGWSAEADWLIQFEDGGAPSRAGVVLLTTPVPVSTALLVAGGMDLEPEVGSALARVEYDPCLAALIRLTGPSLVPAPGGLWLGGEPFAWVGDNTQKGISEVRLGASVTVHAGPLFSREHWDSDPDATGLRMVEGVRAWLGSEVAGVRVHRWRHAIPSVLHPDLYLGLTVPGPLFFAGDAFGGPRVESAALSGLAAAEAILAGWDQG